MGEGGLVSTLTDVRQSQEGKNNNVKRTISGSLYPDLLTFMDTGLFFFLFLNKILFVARIGSITPRRGGWIENFDCFSGFFISEVEHKEKL